MITSRRRARGELDAEHEPPFGSTLSPPPTGQVRNSHWSSALPLYKVTTPTLTTHENENCYPYKYTLTERYKCLKSSGETLSFGESLLIHRYLSREPSFAHPKDPTLFLTIMNETSCLRLYQDLSLSRIKFVHKKSRSYSIRTTFYPRSS